MTINEQLEEVNKAISVILRTGNSYTIESRSVTRADLGKLYQMKTDLEAKANAEEPSMFFDNTYVAFFGNGR